MGLEAAIWYGLGLIFLLLLLYLMARPIEIGLRVLGNSLIGGLGLWLLNLVGGWLGFHIGLNPVSALIVGVLGLPGLLSLSLLRLIMG